MPDVCKTSATSPGAFHGAGAPEAPEVGADIRSPPTPLADCTSPPSPATTVDATEAPEVGAPAGFCLSSGFCLSAGLAARRSEKMPAVRGYWLGPNEASSNHYERIGIQIYLD